MEEITAELKNMNQTLVKMLEIMQKPGNQLTRVLEIVGIGAGVLSVLGAADIIRHWILEGGG